MKTHAASIRVTAICAVGIALGFLSRSAPAEGEDMSWWSAYGAGGRSRSVGDLYDVFDSVGQPAVGGALGGAACGMESGFLTPWAACPSIGGLPLLIAAVDNLGGMARLTWANNALTPAMFLGLAYDLYADSWVERGWNNTLWYPFYPPASAGDLNLGSTGAYFAWISNYYANLDWFVCPNPAAFVMYSGIPHKPLNFQVERIGDKTRLHWSPDIYGVWHWQIIVYEAGAGWTPTQGPCGLALWHFWEHRDRQYCRSRHK
ncbi:MAG: hypothetical protein NTW86_24820 [Candidatus Sumerlaeota bacterium]|nr:hypothetical protein [Candidatus Sumerlaeota bacterium]